MADFHKSGVLFENPSDKVFRILGSVLGSPTLGNYQYPGTASALEKAAAFRYIFGAKEALIKTFNPRPHTPITVSKCFTIP